MRRQIALKNGRSLTAGFSRASKKTPDWIVFLPESGSDFQNGSRAELSRLLGPGLAPRFNYLVINKPGLSPKGTDRKAFERSFRRYRRVEDALSCLKELVPQKSRIYLIGYSEGAYLAPEVARRDRRVEAVVMIGGGTRGWLKEELSNVKDSGRAAMLKQIRHIRRHSRSTEKWNGFSYATWNSYREDTTLKALKNLKLPVLSILGARDRVIDLKATLRDLNVLSRQGPVKTHLLPSCGHSFNGKWPAVQRAVEGFLEESI